MAQKRNRKVAVVQCLGGCHAEAVIPRGDLAGDCSQVLADHPDGILKCKWGCLGMGMTTSEILLLFQTIIALLALLVSVVHLMDDRKKDD